MKAAIVGSGPSLRGVELDFPPDVTVVAVNAAIAHMPTADVWITADPSGANVQILERRFEWPNTQFLVAIPQDTPRLPYPGLEYLHRIDRLWRYDSRTSTPPGNPTLCLRDGWVHHGNSAWVALQRVVQRGKKRVALFGIDGTQEGYAWGPGHPRDIRHLPLLFWSALPQLEESGVQVINGSKDSRVDCFQRVIPEDAIAWLAAQ